MCLSEKRVVKEWEHAPSCCTRCNRCPSHAIQTSFFWKWSTLYGLINFTNYSLIKINTSASHFFSLLSLMQLTILYTALLPPLPSSFNNFMCLSRGLNVIHKIQNTHVNTHTCFFYIYFSYKREPNVGFCFAWLWEPLTLHIFIHLFNSTLTK